MKLLNKITFTTLCCISIFSCIALTPEQQAQVNEQLINAILNRHLPGVEQALSAGANINANDDDALQLAYNSDNLPFVAYLLRHGANQKILRHFDWIDFFLNYILSELQTALATNNWHEVEELLSTVPVQGLAPDLQDLIRNLLVPAVQEKLNSACLVLFARTELTNPQLALSTLSFIVGPNTRAAFNYYIKEDIHEITQ